MRHRHYDFHSTAFTPRRRAPASESTDLDAFFFASVLVCLGYLYVSFMKSDESDEKSEEVDDKNEEFQDVKNEKVDEKNEEFQDVKNEKVDEKNEEGDDREVNPGAANLSPRFMSDEDALAELRKNWTVGGSALPTLSQHIQNTQNNCWLDAVMRILQCLATRGRMEAILGDDGLDTDDIHMLFKEVVKMTLKNLTDSLRASDFEPLLKSFEEKFYAGQKVNAEVDYSAGMMFTPMAVLERVLKLGYFPTLQILKNPDGSLTGLHSSVLQRDAAGKLDWKGCLGKLRFPSRYILLDTEGVKSDVHDDLKNNLYLTSYHADSYYFDVRRRLELKQIFQSFKYKLVAYVVHEGEKHFYTIRKDGDVYMRYDSLGDSPVEFDEWSDKKQIILLLYMHIEFADVGDTVKGFDNDKSKVKSIWSEILRNSAFVEPHVSFFKVPDVHGSVWFNAVVRVMFAIFAREKFSLLRDGKFDDPVKIFYNRMGECLMQLNTADANQNSVVEALKVFTPSLYPLKNATEKEVPWDSLSPNAVLKVLLSLEVFPTTSFDLVDSGYEAVNIHSMQCDGDGKLDLSSGLDRLRYPGHYLLFDTTGCDFKAQPPEEKINIADVFSDSDFEDIEGGFNFTYRLVAAVLRKGDGFYHAVVLRSDKCYDYDTEILEKPMKDMNEFFGKDEIVLLVYQNDKSADGDEELGISDGTEEGGTPPPLVKLPESPPSESNEMNGSSLDPNVGSSGGEGASPSSSFTTAPKKDFKSNSNDERIVDVADGDEDDDDEGQSKLSSEYTGLKHNIDIMKYEEAKRLHEENMKVDADYPARGFEAIENFQNSCWYDTVIRMVQHLSSQEHLKYLIELLDGSTIPMDGVFKRVFERAMLNTTKRLGKRDVGEDLDFIEKAGIGYKRGQFFTLTSILYPLLRTNCFPTIAIRQQYVKGIKQENKYEVTNFIVINKVVDNDLSPEFDASSFLGKYVIFDLTDLKQGMLYKDIEQYYEFEKNGYFLNAMVLFRSENHFYFVKFQDRYGTKQIKYDSLKPDDRNFVEFSDTALYVIFEKFDSA